jgi:hypothetical protein
MTSLPPIRRPFNLKGFFPIPAPPPPATARASSSCRCLPSESPVPGKFEQHSAYGASSSFSPDQHEKPRCIDALICSIKPPAGSNGEASSLLAEGELRPNGMIQKFLLATFDRAKKLCLTKSSMNLKSILAEEV